MGQSFLYKRRLSSGLCQKAKDLPVDWVDIVLSDLRDERGKMMRNESQTVLDLYVQQENRIYQTSAWH